MVNIHETIAHAKIIKNAKDYYASWKFYTSWVKKTHSEFIRSAHSGLSIFCRIKFQFELIVCLRSDHAFVVNFTESWKLSGHLRCFCEVLNEKFWMNALVIQGLKISRITNNIDSISCEIGYSRKADWVVLLLFIPQELLCWFQWVNSPNEWRGAAENRIIMLYSEFADIPWRMDNNVEIFSAHWNFNE
jgi:hypothetical protein